MYMESAFFFSVENKEMKKSQKTVILFQILEYSKK